MKNVHPIMQEALAPFITKKMVSPVIKTKVSILVQIDPSEQYEVLESTENSFCIKVNGARAWVDKNLIAD
jgi:hypothetical protein